MHRKVTERSIDVVIRVFRAPNNDSVHDGYPDSRTSRIRSFINPISQWTPVPITSTTNGTIAKINIMRQSFNFWYRKGAKSEANENGNSKTYRNTYGPTLHHRLYMFWTQPVYPPHLIYDMSNFKLSSCVWLTSILAHNFHPTHTKTFAKRFYSIAMFVQTMLKHAWHKTMARAHTTYATAVRQQNGQFLLLLCLCFGLNPYVAIRS